MRSATLPLLLVTLAIACCRHTVAPASEPSTVETRSNVPDRSPPPTLAEAPVLGEPERSEALAAARDDEPFVALPADAPFDGERLFAPGRVLPSPGGPLSVTVELAGTLALPSGIIAVRDLVGRYRDFAVLRRRVAPGSYRVDVARVADTVAAVRVRFSAAPVVAWHPAINASGRMTVFTDSGSAAIVDAGAFTALPDRQRERLFVDAGSGMRPAAFLALAHANEGVLVRSGNGDGRYPMYFGADSSGQPAVLVVDFRME